MGKSRRGTPFKAHYDSPVGVLEAVGSARGISSLRFVGGKSFKTAGPAPCLRNCLKQLDEYFRGRRKVFSVKLDLRGTEFQKKVWRELLKIPYGRTVSYGDVARSLGDERAARAVGGANRRNPVPVIIPCHRVVGTDGRLTGYGGGLGRKEWLLEHEKRS